MRVISSGEMMGGAWHGGEGEGMNDARGQILVDANPDWRVESFVVISCLPFLPQFGSLTLSSFSQPSEGGREGGPLLRGWHGIVVVPAAGGAAGCWRQTSATRSFSCVNFFFAADRIARARRAARIHLYFPSRIERNGEEFHIPRDHNRPQSSAALKLYSNCILSSSLCNEDEKTCPQTEEWIW